MKLMLPMRSDRFRLKDDLMRNSSFPIIPAGSVFRIEQFTYNKLTKAESRVHCIVMVSPDRTMTMKKYGGTCDFGYNFSLSLAEMRELDVELVEDMV